MSDTYEVNFGTSLGAEEGAHWREADSPVDGPLYGVVDTAAGPFAVGEDGMMVARRPDGTWHTVVTAGTSAKSKALLDVAVTDDGRHVWYAGSAGSLGCYEVTNGRKHDYTAPMEKTSTWEAIATSGPAGDERIGVANGSGEVMPIAMNELGCPQWGEVVEPGGGATVRGMAFGPDVAGTSDKGVASKYGALYAADTNGKAYHILEDKWKKIGVRNAQVNFYNIHAAGRFLLIAADEGRVLRYNRSCGNWTPVSTGEQELYDIGGTQRPIVVGNEGHVAERGPQGWTQLDAPVEADLWGVCRGTDMDVAVGENGTIIERIHDDT